MPLVLLVCYKTLALVPSRLEAQRHTAWLPFIEGCQRAPFQGGTVRRRAVLRVGGVCGRDFNRVKVLSVLWQ